MTVTRARTRTVTRTRTCTRIHMHVHVHVHVHIHMHMHMVNFSLVEFVITNIQILAFACCLILSVCFVHLAFHLLEKHDIFNINWSELIDRLLQHAYK